MSKVELIIRGAKSIVHAQPTDGADSSAGHDIYKGRHVQTLRGPRGREATQVLTLDLRPSDRGINTQGLYGGINAVSRTRRAMDTAP